MSDNPVYPNAGLQVVVRTVVRVEAIQRHTKTFSVTYRILTGESVCVWISLIAIPFVSGGTVGNQMILFGFGNVRRDCCAQEAQRSGVGAWLDNTWIHTWRNVDFVIFPRVANRQIDFDVYRAHVGHRCRSEWGEVTQWKWTNPCQVRGILSSVGDLVAETLETQVDEHESWIPKALQSTITAFYTHHSTITTHFIPTSVSEEDNRTTLSETSSEHSSTTSRGHHCFHHYILVRRLWAYVSCRDMCDIKSVCASFAL